MIEYRKEDLKKNKFKIELLDQQSQKEQQNASYLEYLKHWAFPEGLVIYNHEHKALNKTIVQSLDKNIIYK